MMKHGSSTLLSWQFLTIIPFPASFHLLGFDTHVHINIVFSFDKNKYSFIIISSV